MNREDKLKVIEDAAADSVAANATLEIHKIEKLLQETRNLRGNLKQGILDHLENLKGFMKQQHKRTIEVKVDYLIALEKSSVLTSYADVARLEKPSKPQTSVSSSEQVVLVYPKDGIQDPPIKQQLEQRIDPTSLGFAIAGTRPIQNGGILIKCPTLVYAQHLEQQINTVLHENVIVRLPKKKFPRLILKNVPDFLESESVKEALVKQNKSVSTFLDGLQSDEEKNSAFKLIFPIRSKSKGHRHWVIITHPSIFKAIQSQNSYLYLQWERYKCNEYFSVPRCRKCARIGHSIKYCRNTEETCVSCGDSHLAAICHTQDPVCRNCQLYNEKNNANIDFRHDSFYPKCSTYLQAIENSKLRIDYGQ